MTKDIPFPKIFIERWPERFCEDIVQKFRGQYLSGEMGLFGPNLGGDLFNTDQFITEIAIDRNIKNIYPFVTNERAEADFIYADVLLGTISMVSRTAEFFAIANEFLSHVSKQKDTYLIPLNRPFWYFVDRPFGNLRFPPNCVILTIEKCLPDYRTVPIPYPTNIHFNPERTVFEPTDYQARKTLVTYAGRRRANMRGEIEAQISSDRTGRAKFYDIGTPTKRMDALDSDVMRALHQSKVDAVFSIEPPGDTPSRKSLYDSLMAGAIPVLSANTRFELPFPDHIAWDRAAVFFTESSVRKNIVSFLSMMSQNEIIDRLDYISSINRHIQYCIPVKFSDWDAFACAMQAALKAKIGTVWAWSPKSTAAIASEANQFNLVSRIGALISRGEFVAADNIAKESIQEVEQTHRGIVALFQIAKGMSRVGEAQEYLKSGLQRFPDSPPLLVGLVEMGIISKSVDVKAAVELALERCHDLSALIPLAELLAESTLYVEAEKVAKFIHSRHPNEAKICLILSRLALSRKDFVEARKLADIAEHSLRSSPIFREHVAALEAAVRDSHITEIRSASENISLEANVEKATIEHFGINIVLDPNVMSPRMIDVLKRGVYEHVEGTVLKHIVREGDVVLELGAGIGFVAALLCKMEKTKRVFSYEANPKLINTIRSTIELNLGEYADKCIVQNAVLTNDPAATTAEFFIETDFWASSLIRSKTYVESISVPTQNFNETLRDVRPSVVVCDIEGGEAELFLEADLSGVSRVLLEVHVNRYGRSGMRSIFDSFHSRGFVYDQFYSSKSVLLFSK